MTLYDIQNLKQIYAQKNVLNIKNFQIRSKEIIGVTGSNGSGKSTLLRHLAFLEKPKEGLLSYKNFDYQTLPLNVKREITMLFSEPYLLRRSVEANLLFGLKVRGERENLQKRACEVLELMGLTPRKFLHRKWYELSSGETQRVAFAARLILKPSVLLLDEPTNSLDKSGLPKFSEAVLLANKEWGTTIVITSHNISWLSNIATKIVGLHFGKLVEFPISNLILGKWEEKNNEIVYKFSDGQTISLNNAKKIGEKKGVAIDPRLIKIGEPNDIALKGVIKEITCLNATDEISIKITIGDQTLECIEKREIFVRRKLLPSQTTAFSFKKEDIEVM
jgi:tungstate transport system ATP-binding protein